MIRSLFVLLILTLPIFSFAEEVTDSTKEISHINYQTDAETRDDISLKRIGGIAQIAIGISSFAGLLILTPYLLSEFDSDRDLIFGVPIAFGVEMTTSGVFLLKEANKIARDQQASLIIQPLYNPISHSTGITLSATF